MIKFPSMRVELVDRLQLLVDEEYQARYWGSKEPHWDFDFIVHFFFDDTALSDGGMECVGMILEDEYEAMLSDNICGKINALLNTYGRSQSDVFYKNTVEWKGIVNDARRFLEYLNESLIFKG
jgi:hypothetical protein